MASSALLCLSLSLLVVSSQNFPGRGRTAADATHDQIITTATATAASLRSDCYYCRYRQSSIVAHALVVQVTAAAEWILVPLTPSRFLVDKRQGCHLREASKELGRERALLLTCAPARCLSASNHVRPRERVHSFRALRASASGERTRSGGTPPRPCIDTTMRFCGR